MNSRSAYCKSANRVAWLRNFKLDCSPSASLRNHNLVRAAFPQIASRTFFHSNSNRRASDALPRCVLRGRAAYRKTGAVRALSSLGVITGRADRFQVPA